MITAASAISNDFASISLPAGFSTIPESSIYQLVYTAPDLPVDITPPDAQSTNEILVLEDNINSMQFAVVTYPDISTVPDESFTLPMLVNQNGDLLYGYYDESGTAVIVGTNGDTTGPNGETLTLIPADEYNQPLTQSDAYGSIALVNVNLGFYPLVDENGAILYGYYDEGGTAIIVGTDPDVTGPDGEPLTKLTADENNEPLTLAQFLEEVMKKEKQKVLPGCS